MSVLVPPIKCQGIKTKLVPAIRALCFPPTAGRWIEPFCGSGVVAFNLQPRRALLTDANPHLIAFYQAAQNGSITPSVVAAFLQTEGAQLREQGESHYYHIRERFNATHAPLDFLFLNRACFNGVIRFNRKGGFNTPFCRKPERFALAYITKIVNQVRAVQQVLHERDWTFAVAPFADTLKQAEGNDVVYADPPYSGRHADYYNTWSESDEQTLTALLQNLPCPFVLSTWQENAYRTNAALQAYADRDKFHLCSREHFYHVGSTEDLRHAMTEALITNRPAPVEIKPIAPDKPDDRNQTLRLTDLLEEARAVFPETHLAHDLLRVPVPRRE